MFVDWLGCVASDVLMIEKWLAVRGLTLLNYLQHLSSGGTSDSLELWVFSLAMDHAVTIVSSSTVSSTARDGVDFSQTRVLLLTYTSGHLCMLTYGHEEAGEQSPTEKVPDVLQKRGCPVTPVCAAPSSSEESKNADSDTSTDAEDLMVFDGDRTPISTTIWPGKAVEMSCLWRLSRFWTCT